MSVYVNMLIKTERLYNALEAKGLQYNSPRMVELRELMAKTIKIIEKGGN
jgi:energy-coupling factor transporter transmembrane protein EcfT